MSSEWRKKSELIFGSINFDRWVGSAKFEFKSNLNNIKFDISQTVSEFDETSVVGTVSSNYCVLLNSVAIGVSMWSCKLETLDDLSY